MERLRGPMQKFAMRLFQACRSEYPTGNILFSPFTASTGFLLLYLGADGTTKYELERALALDEIICAGMESGSSDNDVEMAFRFFLIFYSAPFLSIWIQWILFKYISASTKTIQKQALKSPIMYLFLSIKNSAQIV